MFSAAALAGPATPSIRPDLTAAKCRIGKSATGGAYSRANGAKLFRNNAEVWRWSKGGYVMVTFWKKRYLDTLSWLTRQGARRVVLMSEDDHGGLMETVHLLKSPANAARLLRSIEDADQGKLHDRELIEPDKVAPSAT